MDSSSRSSICKIAVLILAGALADVSISISPSVLVKKGTNFWLTCHITPKAENRLLEFGYPGLRTSEVDLAETTRTTWKVLVENVPCDGGPAYCLLTTTARQKRVTAPLQIGGCDEEESGDSRPPDSR